MNFTRGVLSKNKSTTPRKGRGTLQCLNNNTDRFPELEITAVTPKIDLKTNQKSEMDRINNSSENKLLTKEESDISFLYKKLPYLNQNFNILRKIGEGTFSNVYLATLKSDAEHYFAVKHLTQALQDSRIERELQCMEEIGGKDNVASVNAFLKTEKSDCVAFVMPYLPHKRFSDYILELDSKETVLYMKNLFIALNRVHSFGIIHRDVKPGNFLYDRETKQFLLIDFGLAQPVLSDEESTEPIESRNMQMAPIDYSVRKKRKLTNDENEMTPTIAEVRHPPKRLALQQKNNNVPVAAVCVSSATENKLREEMKSPTGGKCEQKSQSVEKTPAKQKTLSVLTSSTSRKKLFTDENVASRSRQSFTPLASRTSGGSFVQVCNSRVVEHRAIRQDDVFQKPSPMSVFGVVCPCSGKPAVCSVCLTRKKMVAPRAGTPGFRPPEVLFKYANQTCAVDMWAAGVMLLCILSGSYPFFKSPNDLTALAEVVTIFGKKAVSKVGFKFGKRVICSGNPKALNLKKLCEVLRTRVKKRNERVRVTNMNSKEYESDMMKCEECNYVIREDGCLCLEEGEMYNCDNSGEDQEFPDSAYHLLSRLLDLDPDSRITASQALNHPFITRQSCVLMLGQV